RVHLWQDIPALDGADHESCKVEIALGVEAWHLRGLAADECTAGFLTSSCDAPNNHRGGVDLELSRRVVVEEEQQFGALDHHIVHAHGDKVLADAVEDTCIDGDLELGSDPVRRSDEYWVLEPGCLQIEQAPEAAQIGVSPGAFGGTCQRRDAL